MVESEFCVLWTGWKEITYKGITYHISSDVHITWFLKRELVSYSRDNGTESESAPVGGEIYVAAKETVEDAQSTSCVIFLFGFEFSLVSVAFIWYRFGGCFCCGWVFFFLGLIFFFFAFVWGCFVFVVFFGFV